MNLNTLEDVQRAYQQLSSTEVKMTTKLDALLAQQCQLEAKMRVVNVLLPRLQTLEENAKHLGDMITFTATLAENVNGKVRELDVTKGRVSECQQRVNDLLDLQLCREGVVTAMRTEDYEKAAAHVHRFLAMDEALLKLTAGDVAQGTNVDSSLILLHEARDQLCEVVRQKFDEAITQGDVASVERFFKIFPLLNMHEEGLKKFSSYLASQLKETAQKNLRLAMNTESSNKRAAVIYADTLTLLLEGVARIVEIHQPLVETYYGPGRLLSVVENLQSECDNQAGQILHEFRKARQFEKKVRQINDLVGPSTRVNLEKCDPRELDSLLIELTLFSARTELYLRFVRRRISADLEIGVPEETLRQEKLNYLEGIFKSKQSLCRTVQELLCQYITLEHYYLTESVNKAAALDTIVDETSLTSSIVDDVFFLVKKSIRRSLSSANVDSICAVINNACSLLEENYCQFFSQQLKQGFPTGYLDLTQAYNVLQSSLQQGRLQASDTEKAKAIFLTALNNVEANIECVETLHKSLEGEVAAALGTSLTPRDREKIQTCSAGFNSLVSKFRSLMELGLQQLRSSAVKPRIKPWIDEFLSVEHDIDEEEFASYEAQDPFVQELIIHLDGFISSFKTSLMPNNYEALVSLLTSEVAQQLEKVILKTKFSRLGGMQLDRELRALIAYLSSATTWTVRDRFARLTQMATLLNLDKLSEISEYWGANSGPITWRLTPSEVRQVLLLR